LSGNDLFLLHAHQINIELLTFACRSATLTPGCGTRRETAPSAREGQA
jgi:hypothetical protein